MNEQRILEIISNKLSVLITLGLFGEEDLKLSDRIALLARFGLSNAEIAHILGTTKGSVEVIKSRLKKKLSKK